MSNKSYSKLFLELFQERPYLLDNSKCNIRIDEYVAHFTKDEGRMSLFCPPAVYHIEAIDELREKLVSTGFWFSDRGRHLYSIFQPEEDFHVFTSYSYISKEDKICVMFDLYSYNNKYFVPFLEANQKFEYNEEESRGVLGFGGLPKG